ncbi:MAG: protein kinase, partial [Candidatus Aminicenantaceae bacterium]
MPIKCPECHFENPGRTAFCGHCGTKLEVQAQSAGSEGIERISVTRTLETNKDELMRGSIFGGRYEVIEELDKGGMGRVYRVHDTKVHEDVALKLIHPEIAADKKVLERFSNELKIARKIVHKNVCRMYHLSEEKGTHYITMEYVAGEDLKSFIRRSGQLAIGTAVKITRQVCEGLSEAHKSGIIHRDLKPGNIMIDKEGKVRIMDFGIARSLLGKGITSEGAIIGTPEYMSTEQVEGKEADQRSDIYALGIILFEMITGRVPFEGETPFSVAFKHKTEPPPAPKKFQPQLPEDLNRLILRCLEKAREKRYQTAEKLLADLTHIEGGIPSTERLIPKRKTTLSKEVTIKFFPKKLIIPGVILLLITAGLFFLRQSLFRKELPLPVPVENSVAVISFSNLTGDPQYDSLIKAVPNLLITKFEGMDFSYVATWERLQDLLKQMDKDPNAPIDADAGIEVCRRDGVNALVVGSITKAGNIFATNIKVLDVKTKKSLASATAQGEGDDSILKTQIDELVGQITESLDIGGQKTGISSLVSDVSTTSLEAYRFYLAGVEAFQNVHPSRARQHFLNALGIDPEFASAYLWLARTSRQLGLDEDGKESLEKALALVDRVNPKEKLYILAYHAIYAENN